MIALVMTMDLAITDLLLPGPRVEAVATVAIGVTGAVMVTDMGRTAVMVRHLAQRPLGNISHHHPLRPGMATALIHRFRHTKIWVRLLASLDRLLHQVWEECINAMLVEA